MLRHIFIKDFAIIRNLDLELQTGMTVITGETGAGKSIVIDALDMALGERADQRWIRHGSERCDIALSFDISHNKEAKHWLQEHDVSDDDECIIKRSITNDGRSRHAINGRPVTLTELKALSQLLIHIHGQHQHQYLVRRDEQRKLLDHFAEHDELLLATKHSFQALQRIEQAIKEISNQTQSEAEKALLQYQLEELETLNLQPDEFTELSKQQAQLTHAESLLHALTEAQQLLTEHEQGADVKSMLEKVISDLALGQTLSTKVASAVQLLESTIVEVTEASAELKQALNDITVDPTELANIEARLGQAFQLARKHKVAPEALPELTNSIAAMLNQHSHHDESLAALQEELPKAKLAFEKAAKNLYLSRVLAAKKLSDLVSESLQNLHMHDATFSIDIAENVENASQFGTCRVEFWVSTNKGQPLQPLAKVASGGEISRISLAIQVITAKHEATPTLVFDEVDVGIGGATAAVVGQLLRQLGEQAQVLCITHLPQVAACGHHHVQIQKLAEDNVTHSTLAALGVTERIQELARMLGDATQSDEAFMHAKAMLTAATS